MLSETAEESCSHVNARTYHATFSRIHLAVSSYFPNFVAIICKKERKMCAATMTNKPKTWAETCTSRGKVYTHIISSKNIVYVAFIGGRFLL